MKKRKKKSLHKFDFNNMPEDLQFIVLFLFMIVGAIITVITYPFRFFKKSQEEEYEEYSFGRYLLVKSSSKYQGSLLAKRILKEESDKRNGSQNKYKNSLLAVAVILVMYLIMFVLLTIRLRIGLNLPK